MFESSRVVAVIAACTVATACGGTDKPAVGSTSSPPVTRTDSATATEAKVEPTDEEQFRAQHFQACDAMCESLTGCAVAEAKAGWDQLSTEAREAVEDETVLTENTRRCASGCQTASLSPRQVKVVRNCLAPMPSDGSIPTMDHCGAFVGCLQAAQKQD